MGKKTIVVFYGGGSADEASLDLAASVFANIDRDKYYVFFVGTASDKSWLFYDGDSAGIKNGMWETLGTRAVISPEGNGIIRIVGDRIKMIAVDGIWPVFSEGFSYREETEGLFRLGGIKYARPKENIFKARPRVKHIICSVADIGGEIKASVLYAFEGENMLVLNERQKRQLYKRAEEAYIGCGHKGRMNIVFRIENEASMAEFTDGHNAVGDASEGSALCRKTEANFRELVRAAADALTAERKN